VRLFGGKNTGLDQDSEILIDQLRAIDNLRFLERLGSIEKENAIELKEKLGLVLDLF
jgi:mRNA interferase MazF